MTPSSVSVQGFTHKNDTCDTRKLSHLRGAAHKPTPIWDTSCKSFRSWDDGEGRGSTKSTTEARRHRGEPGVKGSEKLKLGYTEVDSREIFSLAIPNPLRLQYPRSHPNVSNRRYREFPNCTGGKDEHHFL
jgi:hypothetical protein